MSRFLLVLLTALLLAVAVISTDAATQSYVLQRRVDATGSWEPVSTFTISRNGDSTPKLKQKQPNKEVELSKENKNAFAKAAFVYYRLIREEDTEGKHAVSVALTPCSILRGFEAVDSRTIVLRELLGIAVGAGTSAVGLQTTSETNAFHAKLVDGDECDRSILALFPQVRLETRVGLVEPVAPQSLPDYTELERLMNKAEGKSPRNRQRKRKTDAASAETSSLYGEQSSQHQQQGEEEEEEVTEDNRSFLQKYWLYLVLPFVFSVIQGLMAKK
ncbi:uncharacterized protein TM35_000142770 [Trypanosoma theileri]|uniref:Transmembrane protein n=1 Tax=Trypanosoma theileri TaxID=67003 RepID=A0A1X0NWH6_9TRYP|nr:uncharacterized protein TM35_000142770 [Trypanosoma theileri]ORC89066.1 hypothetical protein TM35_000142770 [Trypanosoma theileri]